MPVSPKQLGLWVSSSCCHPSFALSCREQLQKLQRMRSKQGWGRLVWEAASNRDFSWTSKTQLAEIDRGALCVEERKWQTVSVSGKTIEFQTQDDEPPLQKVRMTQATFQEICRRHSTMLQKQSRRASTVIKKLSYLFKIMDLSPSCLLLTRLGWVGWLWSCQDKTYQGRSPVSGNSCRNSSCESTVLNMEWCRHLVGAQCCLWACPRPKLSTLAVCPGEAVTLLLSLRNTVTSANMPIERESAP